MNKDIATRWAAELESGKYQQAKAMLRDRETGGLCCLGVLCEMSQLGSWMEDETWNNYIQWMYVTGNGDSSKTYLPDSVADWAGMKSWSGHFGTEWVAGEERPKVLAALNDSGKTFAEIAEIIRENWETL